MHHHPPHQQEKPVNTNYSLHGHTLGVVENGKYPGVTITHDRQRKTDINQSYIKASRTLGFFRRIIGRCRPEVKANAYCTIWLNRLWDMPPLCAWDPCQSNLDKGLEQVQRRAARFVFNNYQDVTPGCVTSLLVQHKREPLKHRRTTNRLTMAYKIQTEWWTLNQSDITHLEIPEPDNYISTPSQVPPGNGTLYRTLSHLQPHSKISSPSLPHCLAALAIPI